MESSKFQASGTRCKRATCLKRHSTGIDVTKWCNYVIKGQGELEDPEAVEDAVQMGQVEELMEMAEDENDCARCHLSVRIMELVEQSKPKVDFDHEKTSRKVVIKMSPISCVRAWRPWQAIPRSKKEIRCMLFT
jgi:hypothetical protein